MSENALQQRQKIKSSRVVTETGESREVKIVERGNFHRSWKNRHIQDRDEDTDILIRTQPYGTFNSHGSCEHLETDGIDQDLCNRKSTGRSVAHMCGIKVEDGRPSLIEFEKGRGYRDQKSRDIVENLESDKESDATYCWSELDLPYKIYNMRESIQNLSYDALTSEKNLKAKVEVFACLGTVGVLFQGSLMFGAEVDVFIAAVLITFAYRIGSIQNRAIEPQTNDENVQSYLVIPGRNIEPGTILV